MKRTTTILSALIFLCINANGQKKKEKPITLTITHIQETDKGIEVYARKSYMLYLATFPSLPDSIKRGKTIIANPYHLKNDTCLWVFRRIK